MTAREALTRATEVDEGGRLHVYQTVCRRHGGCQREPLEQDAGRWTWCPDCLTLFDDYGVPVNPLSVRQLARTLGPSSFQ
jgi:hypothetical protein